MKKKKKEKELDETGLQHVLIINTTLRNTTLVLIRICFRVGDHFILAVNALYKAKLKKTRRRLIRFPYKGCFINHFVCTLDNFYVRGEIFSNDARFLYGNLYAMKDKLTLKEFVEITRTLENSVVEQREKYSEDINTR